MSRFRIFRIGLIIALIFVTGIITGRFTAPAPALTTGATLETTGGGTTTMTADGFLRFYYRGLEFDPVQQPRALAAAQAMLDEMAGTPAGSAERFEIFRLWRAKLREIARPQQLRQFDRISRKQDERMQEVLEQNGVPPSTPP